MVSVFALAHQGVQKLRQIKYMFEEYLKQKCEEEGGFDGASDYDYAFEEWSGTKSVDELVQYGEEALLKGYEKIKRDVMPF